MSPNRVLVLLGLLAVTSATLVRYLLADLQWRRVVPIAIVFIGAGVAALRYQREERPAPRGQQRRPDPWAVAVLIALISIAVANVLSWQGVVSATTTLVVRLVAVLAVIWVVVQDRVFRR
jgi:drug/metabolite transporter (DMT)-like permease